MTHGELAIVAEAPGDTQDEPGHDTADAPAAPDSCANNTTHGIEFVAIVDDGNDSRDQEPVEEAPGKPRVVAGMNVDDLNRLVLLDLLEAAENSPFVSKRTEPSWLIGVEKCINE